MTEITRRSVTARMFTRAESAQNHCQVGNYGRALDAIADGLDSMLPARVGSIAETGMKPLPPENSPCNRLLANEEFANYSVRYDCPRFHDRASAHDALNRHAQQHDCSS